MRKVSKRKFRRLLLAEAVQALALCRLFDIDGVNIVRIDDSGLAL